MESRPREIKLCTGSQGHTDSKWGSDPDSFTQSGCFPQPLCSSVRIGVLCRPLDSLLPCLRQDARESSFPMLLWNTFLLSLLESEIHHAACLFSNFSNLRKGWGVGGYLLNTHQAGLLGSASRKMGKIMNAQENSGPLLAGSSVVTGLWELHLEIWEVLSVLHSPVICVS